jgi:hypothetical protein
MNGTGNGPESRDYLHTTHMFIEKLITGPDRKAEKHNHLSIVYAE